MSESKKRDKKPIGTAVDGKSEEGHSQGGKRDFFHSNISFIF